MEVKFMQVSVIFRHMPGSEALKTRSEERVSRLNRYFSEAAAAHVALSIERYNHKADVTINAHGATMRGEFVSGDMYHSIDRAVEKIERQLKRYKNKITSHRPKMGEGKKIHLKFLEGANTPDGEHTVPDHVPKVVETKEINAKPMVLEEAVMHMDLLHNDFLIFLNAKTDHVNVLYRKQGNQYD
jgi:putative sigma-54 modulation protein